MLIAGDLIRLKHTPWRARELSVGSGRKKRFCLVLVKPSHYDDEGYVIQWFRSPRSTVSRKIAPSGACLGLMSRSTFMRLTRPIRASAAIVLPR